MPVLNSDIARSLDKLAAPHIAAIAHPTGRLISGRGGLDLDFERMLTGARERSVALEINGQPDRLDLNEWHCKLANDMGVRLVASTQARRGWIEPAGLINTSDLAALRQALRQQ